MAAAMNATSTFSCPHNGTAHDGTLLCHWTNNPGARGTLNIFWLCISTLGVCVWNAVHPDVPRPNTPRWRVLGKRVGWLFVGLFMPEMLVLVAWVQFRQACKLLVRVDRDTEARVQFPWWIYIFKSWQPTRGDPDYEAQWWVQILMWLGGVLHSVTRPPRREPGYGLRALMRFLRLLPAEASHAPASDADLEAARVEPSTSQDQQPTATVDALAAALGWERQHPWTLTHSYYAVMDGFVDDEAKPIALGHMEPDRIGIPFRYPAHFPDVSVDDIQDRSKAGIVARLLLLWQLFVFLANCFVRWDQSLPLSLLEITTIAHSLCSIIAIVLWWYKPHSVGEATVIDRRGHVPPPPPLVWREIFSRDNLRRTFNRGREKVIPTRPTDERRDIASLMAMDDRFAPIFLIAVLYGLPHLLGLSVQFPSPSEQLCWKIATIVVIISPAYAFTTSWLGVVFAQKRFVHLRVVAKVYTYLTLIFVALYTIASMFLVCESVRQIFALPEGSFQNPQFTRYLPGFS